MKALALKKGLTHNFIGPHKSAWHLFSMMRRLGALNQPDADECIASIIRRREILKGVSYGLV
jgi:hypothetical protein